MARPAYRDSAVWELENRLPVAEYAPEAGPPMEAGKYCAYNQTRGRFLGSDIDAADFTVVSLGDRMPALAPSSGAGLWLLPFRGISAASVRMPLDLVYLDPNCMVIEAVESFPISRVSPSSPLAASVLALPVQTIDSTETRPGDQLLLCAPEEMKRRLLRLPASPIEAGAGQSAAPLRDEPVRGTGRLLQFEDRSKPKRLHEDVANEERLTVAAVAEPPAAPPPAVKEVAEPGQKNGKPAKNWLQRWWSPDPLPPRKAMRESLPGLAAHFWTGGAPVQHSIRDVSPSGLYVITEERWYPGTVVRMTLTDSCEPTAERSITVHTTVVRWGNDGVGLQFVLQNPKDRGRGQNSLAEGVDQRVLDQFLERIRGARA